MQNVLYGEIRKVKTVLPHQLKSDTEMVPEVEVLNHVDEVVLVVFVFSPQGV